MKNEKVLLIITLWGMFIVSVYYHGFLDKTSTVSNIRLSIYHEENVLLRGEENSFHSSRKNDLHNKENVLQKEGNSIHKEENSLHKEGNSLHMEGNSLHKEENNHHKEENSLHKEENSLHKEGNSLHNEENSLHKEENSLHKEENSLHDQESVDITNSSDSVTFKEKYYMVIVIPSMPSSGEFRHYLRTKWLNQSCWRRDEIEPIDPDYLNFKLMFVIGKLPNQQNYSQEFFDELSNNDDMYLINKVESKKILKDKVIFGMRESVKYFTYNYFIKMDHDTMADLPRLAKGLPTLPKKNILAGCCQQTLDKGHFKFSAEVRDMRYCQGGAYVLSHDVIEKIASLSEEETFIKFGRQEPEDLYTAWLVDQVNRKFTDSVVQVIHKRKLVNSFGIDEQEYWFKRWFSHKLKTMEDMEKAFACRIKANFTRCPSAHYYYRSVNSTECLCKD